MKVEIHIHPNMEKVKIIKVGKVKIIKVGKVKIIKQKIEDKQTWWDMWENMFYPEIFHLRFFFFFLMS